MNFEDAISLAQGPERTAAIAAWVQSLFTDKNQVPVLVGGAAVEILTGGAYWKSGVDGANAFVLFRTRRTEIDDDRLNRRARESGFEPALDALRTFDADWSQCEPDAESLERWANAGPEQETS